MKAVRITNTASGPVLTQTSASQPQPGPGELLIRVCAAGVIPTELLWYPTFHSKTGEMRSGAIPGHEFSGVIAGMGSGVSSFEIGQEVYGMNDWYSEGAMAEYCLAPVSAVALKPSRLTHIEAASVPISSLTAWQGLFDHVQLQRGERVLVQGGAGGVGLFVVQLAYGRGAHVVATASTQNLDFLRQLGAEQVIDYQNSRFEESVKEVDVVFDTVGGETLRRSWAVLAPKGRMVTVVSTAEAATDEQTKQAFFIVEPKGAQLVEMGNMLQAGDLRTIVNAVVPFSQADSAYRGTISGRLGRGKLVVAVADS